MAGWGGAEPCGRQSGAKREHLGPGWARSRMPLQSGTPPGAAAALTPRKGAHVNLHHPQLLQRVVWARHKLRLLGGAAAAGRRRLPRRARRQAIQAAQRGHLAAVGQLDSWQRQGGALGGGPGGEVAQRGAAGVEQQLVCKGGRERAAGAAAVSVSGSRGGWPVAGGGRDSAAA